MIVSRSFYSKSLNRWLGFEGFKDGSLYWIAKSMKHTIKNIERSDNYKDIKWEINQLKEYEERAKETLSNMKFSEVM